jgi:hypothetical protein
MYFTNISFSYNELPPYTLAGVELTTFKLQSPGWQRRYLQTTRNMFLYKKEQLCRTWILEQYSHHRCVCLVCVNLSRMTARNGVQQR